MKKLDNVIPLEAFGPFLQDAPLFQSIAFEYNKSIDDGLTYLCNQISIFCPDCKKQVFFHNLSSTPGVSLSETTSQPKKRIIQIDFECTDRSCRCKKSYFIHVHHDDNQLILTKCGEWPSLAPRVSKEILDVFPDDAELLKKAVYCLKDGFGIGAFAYFRQVLEPHISLLVDKITEQAKAQGNKKILSKIAKLQKDSPMAKRIALAKEALPDYLTIDGCNPLGTLYQVLSEGIHNKTDEDCLQKASSLYASLCFLVNALAAQETNRKQYTNAIKSFTKK